ncbi:MAG: LuxR C-terminal-related transcriptional regulator [bacterium]|jgi:ATP/maltotriose-dependent transcriptional regulator MalT
MAIQTTNRSESPKRSAPLTKREIDVLSLITQGLSSREVGVALFVNKRTIDFHLRNIYVKLQVKNRVQAFLLATSLGLIPYKP